MVVVVAGTGIGNVDGHVFGGPDLVGDLDGFVDLVGARKRVGSFVVVAGVGLFAEKLDGIVIGTINPATGA